MPVRVLRHNWAEVARRARHRAESPACGAVFESSPGSAAAIASSHDEIGATELRRAHSGSDLSVPPGCKAVPRGLQEDGWTMFDMNTASCTLIPHTTALAAAGDRMLVVVAHPDDESFGCGSVIAAAADASADVTVVCATPGDRGQSRLHLSPDQLARQRLRELHLSAGVLGVEQVITLGYGDSDFGGPVPAGSLCAAEEEAVVTDLLAVLRAVRPHVVVVLDGSDGHRDHLRIRSATLAAVDVERAAGEEVAVFESSLPNHLMRRWLAEMRTVDPDAAYHAIDPASFGRPDHEITDVVDASAVLHRRELAIAMHVSQSSPFAGLSPELRQAFLATDHLARVR